MRPYIRRWIVGSSIAWVIVGAVVILLGGCATVPTPPPPPLGAPSCDTACERLEQLHCPSAKPTPAGASCVQVCTNIEDSGYVEYGVACVTNAESCDKADHCGGAH